MTGIIYKSIGGFYYVKTADAIIECKPRGIFRKRGEKPVAGDRVELAEEAGTPYIDALQPRKNVFVRPPVANVDVLFIVAGTAEPTPSTLVIDKLTVVAFEAEAQPVLVVTKTDLESPDGLVAAYSSSGVPVIVASAQTCEGLEEIRGMLAGGRLGVFCGNSGVGKSTLLNALMPQRQLETGEISKKLGRGRHTTREVEIFELGGGLVADTPGFASLDLQQASPTLKENLQFDFPEISSRMGDCRFTGCAHMAEKGCAVRQAVEEGEITQSRYSSYQTLYREAKDSEPY